MVKSPGASPERKKVKIDVYPMVVKDPQAREINETLLFDYTTALSSFETPTEEQLLVSEGDAFRHHPNEDVEQYFRASAQWGVPAIAWNIVRPAFLWKLEFCITEFMNVEKKKKEAAANSAQANSEVEKIAESPVKEKLSILGHKVNLIKTTPVVFSTEESMEFVLSKAKSFDGFPFTWQRLCELLIEPMRHYNTIDKFLRAVDKVINVVTTINENGGRSFGDWDLPNSQQFHLENTFFGVVDEVEMMELEKVKHDFQSSSSPSEEPLDMSQKSMPAPRVSTASPDPPSFVLPTARSPINTSPSSSPKASSPKASSPKAASPVSSPKSPVIQDQSPKKEDAKEGEGEIVHEEEMPEETLEVETKNEVNKEDADMEIGAE
ncbi:Protein Phosphatase Four Regulatory subunit [Caenorhabditis elegans]|uniref:Protein Phosphatase Four Regulatory subunit n=1 Tax=Caenorhabditis elegans TaxID=6239 RepID=P91198_CAEEL|nr:Protein Phosphatase Four Regulatory subunit [Caenorhabditis elegans]CCD68493.1 Protein Phosphatase Four Regulatory subunit [Caenorhabditis elegans]|eukprot:NP_491907.1 Protein Phosphatase Four Regulatory subunit [Caenorhabditis elegans]